MAAATPGSNGSPATAAASSSPRAVMESEASSSASDAATALRDNTVGDATHAATVKVARKSAGELLEVEGIAAAVVVHRRHRHRVDSGEQLSRLCLAQRRKRDPGHGGRGQRRRQPRRSLTRTEGQREEDRAAPPAAQQRRDQLDGGAVAPVQVVQDQHERLVIRQDAQQRRDRPMRAIALVRDRRAGERTRAAQAGEHGAQLSGEPVVKRSVSCEVLRGHVRVQRVYPYAERHLAFELGRRAREHQVTALLGARHQLAQQARLADPRLALERKAARGGVVESVERRLELVELPVTPDQRSAAGDRLHLRREAYAVPKGAFRDSVQGAPPMCGIATANTLSRCSPTRPMEAL